MEEKIKYGPIKLLKNTRYPTYQLYATVDKNIGPETALKIAVLETFAWLRQRFSAFDVFPEIDLPQPDDYLSLKPGDIRSFRFNVGYAVDVVYIEEEGVWAFQLTEPDLGPDPGSDRQRRMPVPGRIFETHIAFKITGGSLECGFQTVCAEPEGTREPCEVFRTSVVKMIARNPQLGLRQVIPLKEVPYVLDSRDKIRQLGDFIADESRQMPLVLVAEHTAEPDIAEFCRQVSEIIDTPRASLIRALEEIKFETAKPAGPSVTFNKSAKLLMGFAHVFVLAADKLKEYNEKYGDDFPMTNGGVRIVYPVSFGKTTEVFPYESIIEDKVGFLNSLHESLTGYPKSRAVRYGGVQFMKEARAAERQKNIDAGSTKEEILTAAKQKIEETKADCAERIAAVSRELEQKENNIRRLEEQLRAAEDGKKRLRDECDDIRTREEKWAADYAFFLERRRLLAARPHKIDQFIDWVNEYFAGKIVLLGEAKELLKKLQPGEADLSLLCAAVEFLAYEFRDCQFGQIDCQAMRDRCADMYGRQFEVTPTGDFTIEKYPRFYKVKYGLTYKGKPALKALDMHLKAGIKAEHLLRIYFLIDKEKELIVIGSLPKHLPTVDTGT